MTTAQELHLRSALENENYDQERIDQIILRDKAHDGLVDACKTALNLCASYGITGVRVEKIKKALALAGVRI